MELKITDENLKSALSEAILKSIGEEGQKAILTDAIERLCAPQIVKEMYGSKTTETPSVLQDMFARAVQLHAQKVIATLIDSDAEIRGEIERLVRDSLVAMLRQDDTKIAAGMANAFVTALNKVERDY